MTGVLMALLRRPCFRVFIRSGFATTSSSFTPACCIAPALCSTRPTSTGKKTRSWISSTPVRRKLPGGSTITRARFLRPPMRRTSSRTRATASSMIPDFKSCTSFIAMIAEQRFGFNPRAGGGTGALDRHHRRSALRRRQDGRGNESSGHAVDHGDRNHAGPRLSFRA